MSAPVDYASAAASTIDAHNSKMGWEIDTPQHGLEMLLVDLIWYADREGIDLDEALQNARETFNDTCG